jgi:murein L,D-transpeptidase YcbB/YkuD
VRFAAGLALALTAILAPIVALRAQEAGPDSLHTQESAALADVEREILRERAESIRAGDTQRILGTAIAARNVIASFYDRREFTRAWTDPEKSAQLLRAIRAIEEDGLNPEDYLLTPLEKMHAQIDSMGAASPPDVLVDGDILQTEALTRLGYHVLFGKVDFSAFDPVWNFGRTIHDLDPPAALQNVIDSPDLVAAIEREKPDHPAYLNLKRALAQYRALQKEGGWGRIPSGDNLELGSVDLRVPAIRARLAVTGDTAAPASAPASIADSSADLFDEALESGVKSFQTRHGLQADGVIGARTLEEMNIPIEERIDQIRLNLERARWLLHDIGEEFVIVNVAGYRLYLVRDGKVAWTTRVQVGKTARKTPVFRSEMTYLVFNPTWTVPPLLLREDILPQQRRDRGTLKRMKIRVIDSKGRTVNPSTIDWSRSWGRSFPYTLRQDPGPNNSLGRVKFMFPNEFAVYLHDTPHPELFDKEERAFSSGCIRVEDPLHLADLLLEHEADWSRERIDEVIASEKTTSVTLEKPIPVLLSYWTVWVTDGGLQFRRDLYGRDASVLAGLDAPFRIR